MKKNNIVFILFFSSLLAQHSKIVVTLPENVNKAMALCSGPYGALKQLLIVDNMQVDIAFKGIAKLLETIKSDATRSQEKQCLDFIESVDLTPLELLCVNKKIFKNDLLRTTTTQLAAESLQVMMLKLIPIIQSLGEGAEKIPLTSEWLAKQSNSIKKVALGGTALVGASYALLYLACNQAGYCSVYLPDLTPLLFLLPKIIPAF